MTRREDNIEVRDDTEIGHYRRDIYDLEIRTL